MVQDLKAESTQTQLSYHQGTSCRLLLGKSKDLSTDLEVPGIPWDDCERAVVLLELEEVDGLHDVADEDEVLDGAQLVDVDLRVDERNAVQVLRKDDLNQLICF